MDSYIQQLAEFIRLPPTDDATAFFNAYIKESSVFRGWEWLHWNESLLSLLIDVMNNSGANTFLSKEQIFQQALVANPKLTLVGVESVYAVLKANSKKCNAKSIFIEKVSADGTCYYGFVDGYSKKLEYARLEVIKSFRKLSTDHKIEIVTDPEILKLLEMYPVLIDLFVSRIHDLAKDDYNKNDYNSETEATRRRYMLHIYEQAMKGDDVNLVYIRHASDLAGRYPEFRRIQDEVQALKLYFCMKRIKRMQ